MSAPLAAPSVQNPSASTLWGPVYIGFCVTTAMYGFAGRQAYTYLSTYKHDPWPIRMLVATLVTIDGVITGLFAATLHYYFIQNFGNLKNLASLPTTLPVYNFLTSLVFLLVQLFYVYRMIRIGNDGTASKVLIMVATTATLCGFVLSIGASIALFKCDSLEMFAKTRWMQAVSSATTGVQTVADFTITLSLQYQIGSSRTGLKQMDDSIIKICRFMMTRGILVLLCHAALFITFLAIKNSQIFLIFHQLLPKLYNLTFFTMLVSFEPLRLATRSHLEDATSTNGLAQNIQLEVVQDTETYVFGSQTTKASPQTIASEGHDHRSMHIDKLSLNGSLA